MLCVMVNNDYFQPETKGGHPWVSETRFRTKQNTSAARPRKRPETPPTTTSLKAEGQKDQVMADAKKVGEDVKDAFKKD